jgi:hypothetical protein
MISYHKQRQLPSSCQRESTFFPLRLKKCKWNLEQQIALDPKYFTIFSLTIETCMLMQEGVAHISEQDDPPRLYRISRLTALSSPAHF